MVRPENFGDILCLYFQDMIKDCSRFIAIDLSTLLLVFHIRKIYYICKYILFFIRITNPADLMHLENVKLIFGWQRLVIKSI